MNFDKEINKILEETYFGGSPYEQISGIKKSSSLVFLTKIVRLFI